MKQYIAIDGASRNNGKPTCVSASGLFISQYEDEKLVATKTLSGFEINSTSQRGEMQALKIALGYITCETVIVTDSAYLFNAMTKRWPSRWEDNGWVTSTGGSVANRDLWEDIWSLYLQAEYEVNFFIVKGHLLSLGKVTSCRLLTQDDTGRDLYEACKVKWRNLPAVKASEALRNAMRSSEGSNGYAPDTTLLVDFTCQNLVADTVATKCVELVNSM